MYRNNNEIILEKLKLLREELVRREIDVEIEAAAEYYCDEHFEKLIEDQNLLTFGNKKYVLFEISFAAENVNMSRAIFNMRLAGYSPILAHPERYDFWHRDFSRYESMIDKDVHLQLNINSLTGQYGPDTKRISERLIDRGMVSFIGTDCHHLGHVQLTNTARTNPHLLKLIESGNLLNGEL
jgi:tyrosine-protein phosphatase YwqE